MLRRFVTGSVFLALGLGASSASAAFQAGDVFYIGQAGTVVLATAGGNLSGQMLADAQGYVAGEIAFSADGHASGTSGCNRFSGAVSQQGDVLTLGPLASTRMACPEPLSSQEAAIFALLGQPLRVAVDLTTGSATLTAADGATLALQRRRQ